MNGRYRLDGRTGLVAEAAAISQTYGRAPITATAVPAP